MENGDLNKLIMNQDPEKILNFYTHFNDQNELIKWMKHRPKGRADIYEIEGPKDIIVVIPTESHSTKGAINCRESVFRGFHLIFVESGPNDPYFNYASNCNTGIEVALSYNPKWIVLSNDDMVRIDDPSVLRNNLETLDEHKVSAVFTECSSYHSYPVFLGYPNKIRQLYFMISNKENRMQLKLERKFGIKVVVQNYGSLQRNFFKGYTTVINIGAFGIFSSDYIRSLGNKLFDDVYLNEFEELEASYILRDANLPTATIKYRIGDLIGTGLGRSTVRKYRAIASRSYFNYKISEGKLNFRVDAKHA